MNRQRAERCLTAACVVVLFFLCLLNNAVISGPLILNDELGYLGNAAALAGKDWHSVMAHCAWYSYGWSLVLVPLFRLFSSMQTILRCVNVINALAVVAVFFIQRHMLRRRFKEMNSLWITAASACACCYVDTISHASLFLSETWLLFVYTLITLLVQRLVERPNGKRLAVFGVSLYYLYVCHNRMLAVVIAAVILVAALAVRRSIGIKGVLLFAVSLFASHLVFSAFRAYVVSASWGDAVPSGNDMESGLQFVRYITQPGAIKNFFLMIVTHAFSVGLGSYGLVPLAVLVCAAKLAAILKKKAADEALFDMWLLLSFLGLFAVTVLPKSIPDISSFRVDHVFYMRYFKPAYVILIAYGMLCLVETASQRWMTSYSVNYTGFFLLCTAVSYFVAAKVLTGNEITEQNICCLGLYMRLAAYRPEAILLAGVCGAIGWNILAGLFKRKRAFIAIGIAGFIGINFAEFYAVERGIKAGYALYAQDLPLAEVVQNTDTRGLPVYIASDGNDIARFQCWLMDTTLQYAKDVPADQLPEEAYYAIVSKEAYEALGYRETGGEILGETQRHLFLYVGGQA